MIKRGTIGEILEIETSYGLDKGKPKKNSRLFNREFGGGSILDLGVYPVSISNLIANISNEKNFTIPEIKNASGTIYKSEVDMNAQAELIYNNGITSKINVSINKNLNNVTKVIGTKGELIICEPWLPNKDSVIEIHRNGKIEKLKTNSSLSIFASQIDNFNENIEKKNLKCEYPSMNIDNSVDCMEIMTNWKNQIF